MCPRCDPPVQLDWTDAPRVLLHMAAHILHDPLVRDIIEPCGFCLRPSPQCCFQLRKTKGQRGGTQVDMRKSRGCERLVKFSYKAASDSKKNSPSSNVPMTCPLCPEGAPAVWKYNLVSHLCRAHPHSSLDTYAPLYSVSESEKYGVLEAWKNRHTRRVAKKSPLDGALELCDTHRVVLPLK